MIFKLIELSLTLIAFSRGVKIKISHFFILSSFNFVRIKITFLKNLDYLKKIAVKYGVSKPTNATNLYNKKTTLITLITI